jgi:hypothetical protein
LRAENKDGKLMWQQVSSILMAMVEKRTGSGCGDSEEVKCTGTVIPLASAVHHITAIAVIVF